MHLSYYRSMGMDYSKPLLSKDKTLHYFLTHQAHERMVAVFVFVSFLESIQYKASNSEEKAFKKNFTKFSKLVTIFGLRKVFLPKKNV